MKNFIVFVVLTYIFVGTSFAGKKDPIGMIFGVEGKVEYNKTPYDNKWRKVRRNKFIFEGYQIRTDIKSSAKIALKKTGETFVVKEDSIINVTKSGLTTINGSIKQFENQNKLLGGLMKRFKKSQSYTTVRRSAEKSGISIDAVRNVVISSESPIIMWESVGIDYRYELEVGYNTYLIPPDTGIIEAVIDTFSGKRKFNIKVFKGDKFIMETGKYRSRGRMKERFIKILSRSEQRNIRNAIEAINDNFGDNSFMLGSFYERKKMWFAALEQYKSYLNENPEELEMEPYVFALYKKLKFKKTYKDELSIWNEKMRD